MTDKQTTGHLTVVVCAAGPASDAGLLIEAAHAMGWTTNVIATPAAIRFLSTSEVRELTSIRHEPRDPYTPRDQSAKQPTAIVIAPATFNTINKLANGIADNYALTVVAEAIGAGIPIVVVPFVNSALASRLPYRRSVATLQEEGVRVVGTEDAWLPHEPGSGGNQQQKFPWHRAFEIATKL